MPHLFRVVLFAALHAAATGGPRAAPKRGPTQRTVDSDFQTPNFKQFYYISLNMKAAESASLGQCVMTVGKPGDSAQKTGPKNLFAVETSSVNPAIVPNEIFHAFTHSLCVLHEVRSYFIRKQANSCTRAGSMNPREVRAGHLHPRHPRCDPDNADSLKKYCNSNNEINVVDWSEHRIRTATRPPFLVTTSHAVISKSGMIWQPCGLVGLMNSCGAIRYSAKEAFSLSPLVHVCMPQSPSCPLPHINSPVFTIAQLDDTQIGQFLLESLPRLIANYQLIRSNPNIKIHYGYSAKHRNSTTYINSLHRLTAFRVLKWLGLDSRIITGDVTTTMAILPREGACQDPAYNAYEIAAMRKQLVPLAWKQCDECESVFKRKGIVIDLHSRISIIIQRDKSAKYSQNRFDKSRRWGLDEVETVKTVMTSVLREAESRDDIGPIVVFSDADVDIMECIPCQIRLFSVAKLVIGMHGAGLANTVFMPNGGDVIELLAESTLDVRHLPLVGIFPRLSFIGGLNHFSLLISDVKQASNLSNHPVLTEIYLMTQIRWFYEAKSVRPKSW